MSDNHEYQYPLLSIDIHNTGLSGQKDMVISIFAVMVAQSLPEFGFLKLIHLLEPAIV